MGCQRPGELEDPQRWQVGASWAGFDTDLRFEDGYEPQLRQHGATVSVTRMLDHGWNLRFVGGVLAGGELGEYALGTGWQASVRGSRRWRTAEGAVPFVTTSLALAAGSSPVHDGDPLGRMLATDLRLGSAVGWTVAGVWSPYVSAQLFGGPVFLWLDESGSEDPSLGTDIYHYRLSAGSSLFLGEHLSLFADVAPLGERGLSAGATWSW